MIIVDPYLLLQAPILKIDCKVSKKCYLKMNKCKTLSTRRPTQKPKNLMLKMQIDTRPSYNRKNTVCMLYIASCHVCFWKGHQSSKETQEKQNEFPLERSFGCSIYLGNFLPHSLLACHCFQKHIHLACNKD